MKKINIVFAFFFIFATPAVIAADFKAEDARQFIKTTAEDVIVQVNLRRASLEEDSSQLHSLVNEKMVPYIDFPRISRWILGKHWRKASEQQKSQFTSEFKKLLIKTYSTALLKISNQKITYPQVQGHAKNGKVSVRSEIMLSDRQHLTVQYRMHHKDKNWKIYDISIDGVSLVSTYRSSFSAEIRKVGLDGLLRNLMRKNKEFRL